MIFEDVKRNLWEKKEKKSILIAAHRGTCGGVIVRNTIPAFENALKHDADIIEIDVIKSADDKFYTFHNGNEVQVLGIAKDIREMNSKEIESCFCRNDDRTQLGQKIEKLSDVMEYLRGKCLLNIDRTWFYWKETIEELKRYGMEDQIILKSYADSTLLKELEESESNFMYMPIARTKEDIDLVLKQKINVIGIEMIFPDMNSELIKKEYMAKLRSCGILAWVNAITLDDDIVLSAGFDDRRSIIEGEKAGWGKLIEMGFDIVQTDWPLLLRKYVNSRRADLHIK